MSTQAALIRRPPEDRHPSFVVALAAVFAASFVVVLLSRLLLGFALVGFFPHVDVWLRLLLGSLVAGVAARLVLFVVGGYRLSYPPRCSRCWSAAS